MRCKAETVKLSEGRPARVLDMDFPARDRRMIAAEFLRSALPIGLGTEPPHPDGAGETRRVPASHLPTKGLSRHAHHFRPSSSASATASPAAASSRSAPSASARRPDPGRPVPRRSQAGHGSHRHKAVINIFLGGGPPHQDMWDIKTEAPAEIRGEFKPIATKVPGIQIGEVFPQIAARMDKCVPSSAPSSAPRGGHDAFQCMTGWPAQIAAADGRPAEHRRRRRQAAGPGRSVGAAVRRPGRADAARAVVRLRPARLPRRASTRRSSRTGRAWPT